MRRARAGVVAIAAIAFFAGLSVDHVARAARRDPGQPYRALDSFADVLARIENDYVEPIAERDLVDGAIDGMVARLDAHSQFLRPDAFRALREDTAGELEGVGLELAARDHAIVVVSPIPDAPAARAGIAAGEHIVRIDGASAAGMSLADAIRRMKGPAGTRVALDVASPSAPPRTVALVRERVRIPSVTWRVADAERGCATVRVKAFQEGTDAALGRALDSARVALGGPIRGLVLDLRDDPGGLVEQAVRVADRFLAEGIIVTTEGRAARSVEVERAHAEGTEPPYPLVVLVNGGTASASEIVAGALQDHGRALIVGTRTFGKGSVQSVVELGDGSGLKLTVARYFTPSHRSIQDRGITPDLAVEEGDPAGFAPVGDRQLDAALDALRKGIATPRAQGPTAAAAAR